MRNITTKLKPIALATLMILGAGVAHAGESIEFGDGYKFDWRLNLNYTLATRVSERDALLAGAGNALGNDGNNNFNKGALTANRISALFESKISKGDSGFVFTGSTFYDDVYHGRNDHSTTSPSNSPWPYNSFNSGAERYHGGYSRLLDTYAYTSFKLGDTSRASVRVGRQVVNWGESSYFANIASAQGPFDGAKSGVPGTEVKEAVLPEDQISASIEVTPNWSLLGHYQFGFHETVVPAPGSYLSTSDIVGPGGSCMGTYPGPGRGCTYGARKEDIRPSKSGQWGIGTRYRLTNETEMGLYYLDYKDRSPSMVVNRDYTYQLRYFDDIKMIGSTVSTTFGKLSAYGEVTYRKGTPVLVGSSSTAVRGNVTQLNVGGFYNIGRTAIADDMQLLGEVVAVRVNSVDSNPYGTINNLSFKGRNALAFSGTWVLSYPGIAEGWDMTIPVSYMHQLKGRSLVGSFGGGQGDRRLSLGATFVRKSNFSVNVTYTNYLGSASLDPKYNRQLTDRDQLAVAMKYSF